MVTYRRTEWSDAAAVRAVHSAAARATDPHYDEEQRAAWGRERPLEEYEPDPDEHAVRLVAERDGEVVGLGKAALDDGEVVACYVHPDHQRAGVATGLMDRLEDRLRAAGHDRATLTASLSAVAFYEDRGYERVGESVHETGGVELDVVEMAKQLR